MMRSLCAGTFVLAMASIAHADSESDAKDLFARGRDMRAHGDCAGAAPLFRRAWEIYPQGLGSLRNLAECEQSLGHYTSSRRAWLDLSRALLVEHDAKYAGWDDEAKKNAADLQAKVASLQVNVTVSSADGEGPANESSPIQVSLNNEVIPLKLLGAPLDRDPGKYRVRVEGDRVEEPIEKSVELVPGKAETLAIIVKLKAPPSIAVAPVAPEQTRASPALLWGGIVLTGLGVAAGIGSAIAFGVRQSALSDVQKVCSSYMGCDPALMPTVSRGQTASAVSTALFIGALAAGAAGITMLALSPAVRVKASAAAVSLEGAF